MTKKRKQEEDPRRYIVVGAGGVGGWLCSGLARMIEYRNPGSVLMIIDGDHFEPRNAERQDFAEIGNKAEVRAKELQKSFPNVFFAADNRWIVEKSDPDSESVLAASELLKDGDVVFATVDNYAARKTIFDAAREVDNIDIFTGGNDEELYGSVYHYVRRDGRDVTDHPAEMHPELEDPPDRNPGEMSCQERAKIEGSTQTLAANMAVASFLLARVHKTILEGMEDKESEIMFDLSVGLAQSYNRAVQLELESVSN